MPVFLRIIFFLLFFRFLQKTMGKKVTVAACTLNQLAMDFEGNLNRILQSIIIAKENFATYRSGPELEISGYSCEDHFFESDTHLHCWQILVELLKNPICQGIMIDVGMPVRHRTAVYNCRVVFLDKKILLIRPKLLMCDDGNYRETRWFTPWRKLQEVEDYYLPHIVTKVAGQELVPFGDAVIATHDTCIGYEICEELWNPQSSHIPMSLDGVEVILNSSGSYMQLRKANIVDDLITSATYKCGGCYVYSNLRGCDGQRTFFNGGSLIAVNGQIVSKGEQFSLKEVEVTCATIDLEDIRSYRATRRSLCSLSNTSSSYKRINVNYSLHSKVNIPSLPIKVHGHSPEEEIAYGPACWLWDYLRRSGQGGFFLPLSGGVDSSSTACIVYAMCHLIYHSDDNQVLADVRKMVGNPKFTPQSPQEICNMLFVTSYIGTENSSLETKQRALELSRQIGSYHLSFNMDAVVQTVISVFTLVTGLTPKFKVHGGTERESLALQNIQARLRMVLSYFFAQLMLWVRGRQGGLLVLGSANVDEALRGYLTKYDCSSADVNPIGGISKKDLKLFLTFMSENFGLTIVDSILEAPPTAELEPLQGFNVVQTDEVDMGMTYDELNTYGVMRKIHNCGPYSMFCKLLPQWNGDHTPEEVADKVKHFFRCYAINRHKMTVLTPSIHVESYSPDDNRFDHRQFLYNVRWPWQFKAIDNAVKDIVRSKGVSV